MAKVGASIRGLAPAALALGRAAGGRGRELRAHRLSAITVLAVTVLMGCASLNPSVSPVSVPAKEEGKISQNGWWYARFIMQWPQGKEPVWSIDPFLAHQVVAPVLNQYRNDIVLWRFHRRAARDGAGHQFSFVFYSSPDSARKVFAAFRADGRLSAMKDQGLIVREEYDDTDSISRPNIEDTSDRLWSSSIQKSWPYYIQGVSEMWLGLIEEVAGQTTGGKALSSLKEELSLYEHVNATIEHMWREEGQHAFLHHLNAIFGYEPITIREKRLMNF